jgi:putative PIG3 family NAD(P)H quinone oxidoreductase
MRAIVITRRGGPEVLEQHARPTPEPAAGQIRVRVHASALNRADLLQRRGGYPAPPNAPADVPGLEYAGAVDALGDGATLWRPGDRVMGIVGGGGHAEHVVVHEREAIPVPDELPWEEAAAVPEVFLTAHDALRQLDLRAGERLLLHAVGSGVGTAALQLARAAGATVLGSSRTVEKLDRARALGLELPVLAIDDEWPARVEEAVGREAIHAVVELVGGAYVAGDLRVLAPRGRLILVGLVAGARTPIDLALILRKRLHVIGTVLRARPLEEKIALARDFAERALPLLASRRVRPVVDRVFDFADIRAAHELLESNATFGKIVLRWDR